MNDWLESHQGASGRYKVMETLSPIDKLIGKKMVYLICAQKIWNIQKGLKIVL